MIIYKCVCGSTLIADNNTEESRKAKREWKLKHGTRRRRTVVSLPYGKEEELHNPGHGYTRHQLKKKDIKNFQD